MAAVRRSSRAKAASAKARENAEIAASSSSPRGSGAGAGGGARAGGKRGATAGHGGMGDAAAHGDAPAASPGGTLALSVAPSVEHGSKRAKGGSKATSVSSGEGGKEYSWEEVKRVQNLIEVCLKSHMTQTEVVAALQMRASVEPQLTCLVWQKLEAQNPQFFYVYNLRLRLKDQIQAFNYLVDQQVQLVAQIRTSNALGARGLSMGMGLSSPSAVASALKRKRDGTSGVGASSPSVAPSPSTSKAGGASEASSARARAAVHARPSALSSDKEGSGTPTGSPGHNSVISPSAFGAAASAAAAGPDAPAAANTNAGDVSLAKLATVRSALSAQSK